MAVDWQAGDLALCVKSGTWVEICSRTKVDGPRPGAVLEVKHAAVWTMWLQQVVVLQLDGFLSVVYNAKYFAKIKPLSKDEKLQFDIDLAVCDCAFPGAKMPFIAAPNHRHNV